MTAVVRVEETKATEVEARTGCLAADGATQQGTEEITAKILGPCDYMVAILDFNSDNTEVNTHTNIITGLVRTFNIFFKCRHRRAGCLVKGADCIGK